MDRDIKADILGPHMGANSCIIYLYLLFHFYYRLN